MSEPSRFRKKPVVIEAWQVPADARLWHRIAEWCGGIAHIENIGPSGTLYGPAIAIETLEGTMNADVGDWIIRGVQGEHYPCKPEIFVATYDPEDEDGEA